MIQHFQGFLDSLLSCLFLFLPLRSSAILFLMGIAFSQIVRTMPRNLSRRDQQGVGDTAQRKCSVLNLSKCRSSDFETGWPLLPASSLPEVTQAVLPSSLPCLFSYLNFEYVPVCYNSARSGSSTGIPSTTGYFRPHFSQRMRPPSCTRPAWQTGQASLARVSVIRTVYASFTMNMR